MSITINIIGGIALRSYFLKVSEAKNISQLLIVDPVVAITIAIRPVGMRVPIVSPVKVSWVGFRLSQSKRGKGENYDLQMTIGMRVKNKEKYFFFLPATSW